MKRSRRFRSPTRPEFHTQDQRPNSVEPESLEHLPPSRLKPSPKNARVHSPKQIQQIGKSIERFGFTAPVLIDQDENILAGHGRVAAAKLLNLPSVPCLRLKNLTEAEKRAYVIADNKLGLNARWDEELLAQELQGLLCERLDFDIGLTGFSVPEIDGLIEGLVPEEPGNPADDLFPNEAPRRCQPGDFWQLGPHRLLCASALDSENVQALMNGEQAQMVFTDPPYNLPVNGHVGGKGAIKHREFAMASGEMSTVQFTEFLRTAFNRLVEVSIDGSIHFICMDWRHMAEILAAGESIFAELKNLIVWVKDNAGMGTFYRSRHELIFVFRQGSAPHTNNFELGQHGRYRTNVWSYRGANTIGAGRLADLALHPTVKPVQMIADAIKDVSRPGGIVVDLFGGSGSTLIAAHKTRRRGYLCEIDPIYGDRILHRWETFAKDDATLASRSGRRRNGRFP